METRSRGFVRRFRDEVNVYRAVLSDPRTPRVGRWLLAGAVAYAVSPIDLIPVVGHLDDLLI